MPVSDRDDILDAFREARATVDEIGLRRAIVYTLRREWRYSADAPWALSEERGIGYPIDTVRMIVADPVTGLGAPSVGSALDIPGKARMAAMSVGTVREGDLQIGKIQPKLGAVGYEIPDLVLRPENAAQECFIIVEYRSGTAWHDREGSDRLLVPGPYTEAQAYDVLNALLAAYAVHFAAAAVGDIPDAHFVADTQVLPVTPATDLASAIALANDLRTAWIAHRANVFAHFEEDPYSLDTAAATDAQTLLVLTNDLLDAYNKHVARGPVIETTVMSFSDTKSFELSLVVRPTTAKGAST